MQIKVKEPSIPRIALIRSCAALIAVSAGAVSCAGAPVRKDVTTTAAASEQAHCGKGLEEDPRIFAPDVVTGVSPIMRSLRVGKSERQELAGAELGIRAQPGLTSEWITRNLICHQARRLLGHAKELHDDAYWLSGSWLEFAVRSQGDVFFVEIHAEDQEAANAVLARSRAFVANHGVAPGQAAL